MKYSKEEKEKIATIIMQINEYLNNERKNLRDTVRINIPNKDGYEIKLVIPAYKERYDTESLLIIGCATYYFERRDKDDWLHCLQCRCENAAYIINYWNQIKTQLQQAIIEQNKQIDNINNFML